MAQSTFKKTKIVKDDGRYLIYYAFDEEGGGDDASPSGGAEQAAEQPVGEARPSQDAQGRDGPR